MAVALESFSIREYAAKTRSAEFEKCWPFDGEGKKGGPGCSLPPISVRKFRWWADELEAVRSAHPSGEKPGENERALEGEAAANNKASKAPDLDAETVEEEGKQMRTPSRGKQRAPKKRSIVELFSVAPPIEKAAGDEEASSDDGSEEEEDEAGVVLAREKTGERKDEENNLGEDCEVGGTRKEASETPRKRKERAEKTAKKKKGTKEKKKKKKKKKLTVEICAAKQDKFRKPKMPFAVDISPLLQCSVHKKRFMKTLKCPVDRPKKKPATKSFPKKHKHVQTSKLISRKQKDVTKVLPIHSILKKRNRGLSMKKASAIGDSLSSDVIKLCRDSAKHVSFSGKDDILGHKESRSPMELPQLQSICKIFSDVLAASSAMNNPSKIDKLPLATREVQVVNDSEADTSTSVVEKRVGCLPEMQQVDDAHGHIASSELLDSSNGNCHDTKKSSLVESVDLNHDLQSYDNLNCIDTDSSNLSSNPSGSQVQVITHKEALHLNGEVHAEESLPRISDAGNMAPVGNHVPWSDAVSSLTTNRNSSQQLASCLAVHMGNNERQPSPSIEPKIGICSHCPDFRQVGFPSPKDSVSSMCSSVGSKRFEQSRMTADPANFGHLRMPSDQISLYRDKCFDDDFVGLPLNSQGEFIKHSNSKFGFNELFKKHNTVSGSSHSCSASNPPEPRNSMDHVKVKGKIPGVAICQKDMSDWLLEQNHPSSKMLTYSSGYIELQGYESMGVQDRELMKDKDFILQHDSDVMKVSCNGCKQLNQIHHCINVMREQSQAEANLEHRFQPAVQPTMRLMGKNVTVGRSSKDCQGLDDGKIWTDKEIITEDRPSVRVSDKPPSRRWPEQEWGHTAYGMPKGSFLQPLEAPSSLFHLPVVCTRSDLMNFDFRPQLMSRDGLSSSFRSHNSPLDCFNHPLPPHALLSKTSKPSVISNPATESIKMGHQPLLGSHHQDVCQHMLLGSTHCKHSQSVCHSASSTFHPSFLNQGYVSFAQPSFAHSSSNLPQWLLDAAQQTKNQKSSCPSYSNPISAHQSCNFFPQPSPYPTSVMSFPVYGASASQACGSSIPASAVQTSVVPSFSVNNSSSVVNSTYQTKIKSRDGTKSSFTCFKGLDHANRNRKRLAAKDDGLMRPAKKPTMRVQEDSNTFTGQGGKEQLRGYTQIKTGALDLHACGSKTIDASLSVVDIEKDRVRTTPRSSSYKADGAPRSGPFKLSAGTKHILKPSQSTGHDNSKTVHSTVPFAIGNSSGGVAVSQKKSAKVYRF